jgi:GNAT superfamily N-acetyltransferase
LSVGKDLNDGVPAGKLGITITYLEMTDTQPRQPLPRAPGDKIALMRAFQPPVSFYRYLYSAVGEPWLWYERRKMDDEALAAIIQSREVEIYVLYKGGVPAGFVEVDRRSRVDVELSYFGLLPEFVGQGLGPYLLGWGIHAAFSCGADRLRVNTCTLDHPKALATYQRAGFVPVRQQSLIVDDPRVLGILPRHAAPHIPINEG